MRHLPLEQLLEERKPFSQRDVVLERAHDRIAIAALSAQLLGRFEQVLADRDRRAHRMQNLSLPDAEVNEICIRSELCA